MPTSAWENIPPILNEIHRLQPQRVLDLGIGCGKYGALIRELLDGIWGRVRKEQWTHEVCGIEIFEDYRNPLWTVYDSVTIGDFATIEGARVSGWDLVLMVDSLEHLPPDEGGRFLAYLVKHNKHVIVSVPNGPMPQNEPVYGNAHERHLATYYGPEFSGYRSTVLHRGLCLVVSIAGEG